MKIYVVYDSKSESYGMPMFIKTKGVAVRNFIEEVNRPDSVICKNPEDFTLFEIGEYDESKGKITPYDTKYSVGIASEFKKEL